MVASGLLTALRYERIYPILRESARFDQGAHGFDRFVESESLEHRAELDPGSVERWLDVGEHWLRVGNFIRSAYAFERAHELAPDDARILLRRAAALETLDPQRSEQAIAAAMSLGAARPTSANALAISPPAPGELIATIHIDMNDMVQYLAVNTSFSGIQRVVGNIFRQVQRASGPNARNVTPVLPDYRNKIVYAADIDLFHELIDTVERGRPTEVHIARLLSAINLSLRRIEPCAGDIFMLAGAFWILPSYDLLKQLRLNGVEITVFVHDLIQINNPGYVQPDATAVFRRSLIDVAELASFFTTNSAFVANEVRYFLDTQMGLRLPVHPVPLATEMSLIPPEPWEDEAIQMQFGEDGFVLCVSTLEIRKNHIYLVRIWERLIAYGQDRLPTLVLVGKWGWEIDPLREALEQNGYLRGRIRIMPAVTDSVLAGLYRNCLFTVYPSFAEGWGLPIGESLAFGKPCIASGVTAMPEVGGQLVRYIDPLDLEAGVAAVKQVLDDRPALAAWTERVRTSFRPRSWAAFTEHLLGATRAMAKQATRPAAFARLLPGRMVGLGNARVEGAVKASQSLRTGRMIRDKGWRHNEELGAWTISPMATLRFIAQDCDLGATIRIVLALQGFDDGTIACRIVSNCETTPFRLVHARLSFHACEARVETGGLVTLAIASRGSPGRIESDDAFVNLSRVGFARIDDPDDAIRLMEAIHFEDWQT